MTDEPAANQPDAAAVPPANQPEPAANQPEPPANQPDAAAVPPPEPVAPEPEAAAPQPHLTAAFGEASDASPVVPAPESRPAVPGPGPGPAVPWEQPAGSAVPTEEPGRPGAEPPLEAGTLWQATGKPRSRRKRIAVVAIAVFGGLLAVGYIGSAINRAANDYASAFYGGTFQKLPADDRKAIEDRFDKMLSGPLKGLSDEQVTVRLTELVKGGLRRLDDASLVRRLKLESVAMAAASEVDCGAISRASLAGKQVGNDVSARIVGNLDPTQLTEWIDLQADAIEAELAGTPPQRTLTQSEIDSAVQAIFESMDQASVDRIVAVNANPSAATDADVCSAIRSIYERSVNLPSPALERFARYDVS